MKKMSNGQDATLGNYRTLASLFFGESSAAVSFLDDKIKESPKGQHEEVIADESQVVNLLMNMNKGICDES